MGELTEKLINHYQWCIDNMPEKGWGIFLIDNSVEYDVDFCALSEFREYIKSNKFYKYTENKSYFCKPPHTATSYSDAKELLQMRLDRLKECPID